MVLLKGEKVRLRPIEPDDVKEVYRMVNDPEIFGEFDAFQLSSWGEVEKWFRESVRPDEFTVFIVEENQTKTMIGIVVYYTVHPVMQNTEIGFQIRSESERNKGYGTEAVKLLIEYLFSTRDVKRIQAITDVGNRAAQRVLEKNGFTREGILRKALFRRGEFHDTYVYSILREEWTNRRT
ncbi:MAG: GNAT family N-acetyltransferase [Nitrososphaeria archaeon]